ncbi:MAG: hypothetical protein ACRDBF_02980, partial [Plesiomonas shigelloides]
LYSYDNLLIESKEKYRQTNKVSVKRIKGFFYNSSGYKNGARKTAKCKWEVERKKEREIISAIK